MDDAMVEPANKLEIKQEAKRSKEDDDKQSKSQKGNEKNKQLELYQQLMDPKNRDDVDISMNTGCTACVCFISDQKIYCANAGDSRAILCKNGVAYALSIDHKPDMESEKKRIYKADGWVSDGRVKGINIKSYF
jgi:serine/threonine protein phosphatase PrpC